MQGRKGEDAISYNRNMKDLYERLRKRGFDAKFVRERVLPDWWDDLLASVPANRAIAEMAIARHLGFSIAELCDPAASLTLPSVSSFRLKCRKGTTPSKVQPAVVVAQRAANLVLGSLTGLPPFVAGLPAQEIRNEILDEESCVDLKSLVNFCWGHGIAVIHLNPDHLPKAKRFDGLAMYPAAGPVVVLCYRSHSPPWLAFHLAHEMGHFFREHVKSGGTPLVDSKLNTVGNDSEEKDILEETAVHGVFTMYSEA